jgi:hypothetical protein
MITIIYGQVRQTALSNIIVKRSANKLRFRFINYNERDGLQGREFTMNASYKTRSGELIFGGGNGFNIFKPANLHTSKNIPAADFYRFSGV